MNEFVIGMIPIVVIWTLPIAPMLYAAVAATIEMLTGPAKDQRVPVNAGAAVLKGRAEAHQLTAFTTGERQAA